MRARALLATLSLALGVAGVPGTGGATVPTPSVTAAPAGLRGHALWDSWHTLGELGYTDTEYFVPASQRASRRRGRRRRTRRGSSCRGRSPPPPSTAR